MRVQRGKTLAAGVAGVLALGTMAACGGGSDAPKQVIWGESTGAISNLMPLISAGNSTANGNLVTRVLDGLYRSAPSISYVPDTDQGTATSSVVNGQQVVTVKVNPKAVWDDGKPITADDYIFTADAQKSNDPKKGGCDALLSTVGFDQIESAKKVDERTAQFTFAKGKSFADWKGLFSGNSALLLSKHVVDQGSAKATCDYIRKGWPVKNGIPKGAVNGPWLIQGKDVDTQKKTITLTPNTKYWGAKPKLDRVIYKTIGSESDTNIKALQNDEVNIIYPQPQLDLVANLKKVSGIKTQISFGSSFEHLDFNTKDPLLKFKQVRQAIAYAIDRNSVVSATVGKFSDKATVLGNRLILSNQKGYVDNGKDLGYDTQNVAKAKQLIESVGGKMGSNGIYTINGKPLSFKVMTTQQNPLRDSTITRIAAQVKAAGIQLTEFANPDIFEGPEKPTSLAALGFQIALFAWVGSPSISSANSIYFSREKTNGAIGQNYSGGGTSQIDSALDAEAQALTPSTQISEANKADKLLWDEMYTLPLYQKPTLLAYSDNIQGLADNATLAGPMWNSDTFSLK